MYTGHRVFLAVLAFACLILFTTASPLDIIETRNGTSIEKRAFSNAKFTYFVEKGTGACGKKNKDTDHVGL